MQKSKKLTQLFKIVLTAVLVALNVVLERIVPSFKTDYQDISFGFVAVALAAAFLGTPYAAAVAGIGDIIGAILFPFGTGYFPGFTATNCIYGILLAVFIYENATVLKIGICVVVNKVLCSLLLNTLWICLVYDGGVHTFNARFIVRVPGTAILAAVELVVLILVFASKSPARKLLDKNIKKFI